MTRLLPSANVEKESDRYFLAMYRRALQQDFHIVRMDNWTPGGIRSAGEDIFTRWQAKNLGRIIVEDNGYSKQTHFSVSEAGVLHGERLLARSRRSSFRARIAKTLWPAISGIAALIAAVAAVFAAYFSYLSLQGS